MGTVTDVDWKARYEEAERRRADTEQACEMWKCKSDALEAMLQARNVFRSIRPCTSDNVPA